MISENIQECQQILNVLLKQDKIQIFLKPVIETNPELKEIYLKQISNPMDLGTISVRKKKNKN